MVSVSVRGLTKRYGSVLAVSNLDLEVNDGEFLVLLGPSGCGKSTALNCVAGLETPDEGEIYIGDRLVNEVEPKDRDVAMVFQSYALYPHMTVRKNIALPLQARKVSKGEISAKVEEVTEMLGIGDLLDRKPGQLSGGEAQRVALGRAVVRKPKVFLMDEPLSNLDAKLRLQMRVELKRIQMDLGITTIYVTHDQAEAMTMGDRVSIMKAGAVQQVDTIESVYDAPSNVFVAGFVGSPPMNLIECSFVDDGKDLLELEGLALPLPEKLTSILRSAPTKDRLVLGLRPEDIQINTRSRDEIKIEGVIYGLEPLGSHTIVDVQVGKSIVRVAAEAKYKGKLSKPVTLTFEPSAAHFFDAKGMLMV